MQAKRESLDLSADPAAGLAAAQTALKRFVEDQRKAQEERIRDETELERYRQQGLYQKQVMLEENTEAIRVRLERERIRAEAVQKLYLSLRDEQQKATEAVTSHLSKKVTRLMGAALGLNVRPFFGDKMLPSKLILDDQKQLEMDQLSSGTLDQIALMTRLAFGEFYCRASGRHAFVLDDPLVNTDRERRYRILDILARSTKDLQVIIFTCHPDQYFGLPEELTTQISLEEVVQAVHEG